MAAVVAVKALRHRRRIVAAVGTVLTVAVAAPLGVVVVAVGGTGGTAVSGASLGVPEVALAAYRAAADTAPTLAGGCVVRWQVLAGVGEIESGHGSAGGATLDASGTVSPPIIGPPTRIADSDGGALDGDRGGDRAVGPMQFMPATWAATAVDADGDGRVDPQDIDDAALAAALYLCGTPAADLSAPVALRATLYRYNRSWAYVDDVMAWVEHYDAAAAGQVVAGAPTGSLVSVRGIEVDAGLAGPLEALLAAADAAGLTFTGSGWRSSQGQIELRRAHCGSSRYAIYEMPSSQCSPPTARPGRSMHEQGLAVDLSCDGALIRTRSSRCFTWLAANAPTYGLHNLPSEPWHWSVNGN